MSLTLFCTSAPKNGFPRVSGDEPPQLTDFMSWMSFSPRERG